MDFEIIVVNYNTDFYLYNLLRSIRDVAPHSAMRRVHVWDNGSTDKSLPMLEQFATQAPWLSIYQSPTNIYHGPALDRLINKHCIVPWVLVLDSDTELKKDFVGNLPSLEPVAPVFVGQIAAINQLYAQLCHLLLNREWYGRLPPFRHYGAPGIDMFRYVEDNGLPYRRFRWSDYVAHFGQGTLRRVYERGEKETPGSAPA